MIHEFTKENIDAIAEVLQTKAKPLGNDVFRFEGSNPDEGRRLALEIHLGMEVSGERMNMVSVYAQNTFLQLHNCTAFIASDMLKQVTFFQMNLLNAALFNKNLGFRSYPTSRFWVICHLL